MIVIRGESSGKGSAQVLFDVMPVVGPPRTCTWSGISNDTWIVRTSPER